MYTRLHTLICIYTHTTYLSYDKNATGNLTDGLYTIYIYIHTHKYTYTHILHNCRMIENVTGNVTDNPYICKYIYIHTHTYIYTHTPYLSYDKCNWQRDR